MHGKVVHSIENPWKFKTWKCEKFKNTNSISWSRHWYLISIGKGEGHCHINTHNTRSTVHCTLAEDFTFDATHHNYSVYSFNIGTMPSHTLQDWSEIDRYDKLLFSFHSYQIEYDKWRDCSLSQLTLHQNQPIIDGTFSCRFQPDHPRSGRNFVRSKTFHSRFLECRVDQGNASSWGNSARNLLFR